MSLPNFIIDRRTRERLNDSELKPATKTILKEINDSVILLGVLQAAEEVIALNEKPPVDADIVTEKINLGWIKTGDGFDEWEPSSVMQISHNISPNFSTVILGEDDLFSKYTWAEKLMGRAQRNRFLFSLDDSDIFLKDNEEAAALLKDLKFEQGQAFPVTYNTDFNMETDESFSRIFFYGMGCVLLTQQEEVSHSHLGPFVVDMPYQDLKVSGPTMSLYRRLTLLVAFTLSNATAFSAVPKGVEIRVCQDRDCLTDGALQANEILETLVKNSSSKAPVTVTKCACLGPCGKGPNVAVEVDGVRLKNFYVFEQIDSAEAAAAMLAEAGITVNEKSINSELKVESTRSFWDFDRTTRIAFQRLLYACVALPLIDADKTGTWDVINGEVYTNSYYGIAAIIFIGSQFMGTGSKSNSMEKVEE